MQPLPFELPPDISRTLEGDGVRVDIGVSDAEVYRYGERFLKTQRRNPRDAVYGGLSAEYERLRWLADRIAVPAIVAFAQDDTRDHLVTAALPGADAVAVGTAGDIRTLVDVLADASRALHAVSVVDCPFDETADTLIAQAKVRLDTGLVDASDFDPARQGRDPHALFAGLLALRPAREDRVLTHGDLCLPNIIVAGGRVTGFVDVGRAGIGDRRRDIALCARSIATSWGHRWAETFIDAYGVGRNDRALEFYQVLDEFF